MSFSSPLIGPRGKSGARHPVSSPRRGERLGGDNLSMMMIKPVLQDHDGRPLRGERVKPLCDGRVGDAVPLIGAWRARLRMPEQAHLATAMACFNSATVRALSACRQGRPETAAEDSGRGRDAPGARLRRVSRPHPETF